MVNEKPAHWEVSRNRMRTVANNILLHLHPTRIPAQALRFSYTWGLGGIATLLSLVLLTTGALLVFRYDPTVGGAYLSIIALETKVPFGSLIRALHHWSANLLLIVTFLHLLRVVFTGGYKDGRRTNYVIGVLLFINVLAFNFTGYLLPWDQLAYWAITVGTSLLSYIPLIGTRLQAFILAGPEVGQEALSNSYAIHVAFLPAIMLTMMIYHFWKIRKNGGISFPGVQNEGKDSGYEPVKRVTTMPYLVQREITTALIVLCALLVFAMLVPAPLEAIANESASPNPAKAAWYFVGIQEFLLHMHPQAAMTFLGFILVGMFALPFLDRNSDDIGVYFRSNIGIRAAAIGAATSLYLIPLLIILDEFVLDLDAWMPGAPSFIVSGLLPLGFSLAGLLILYGSLRFYLKANGSEATLGVFTFLVVSLVLLTLTGVFFRGPNMALQIPF